MLMRENGTVKMQPPVVLLRGAEVIYLELV
jgi:hypothetical protein